MGGTGVEGKREDEGWKRVDETTYGLLLLSTSKTKTEAKILMLRTIDRLVVVISSSKLRSSRGYTPAPRKRVVL